MGHQLPVAVADSLPEEAGAAQTPRRYFVEVTDRETVAINMEEVTAAALSIIARAPPSLAGPAGRWRRPGNRASPLPRCLLRSAA